jgi:hypothetical protein
MSKMGSIHYLGGVIAHKRHGSRLVENAVLDSKATVVDNANHRHFHQTLETVEQALIHGIADGHTGVDNESEQYETESFVPVVGRRQVFADKGDSPSDK